MCLLISRDDVTCQQGEDVVAVNKYRQSVISIQSMMFHVNMPLSYETSYDDETLVRECNSTGHCTTAIKAVKEKHDLLVHLVVP